MAHQNNGTYLWSQWACANMHKRRRAKKWWRGRPKNEVRNRQSDSPEMPRFKRVKGMRLSRSRSSTNSITSIYGGSFNNLIDQQLQLFKFGKIAFSFFRSTVMGVAFKIVWAFYDMNKHTSTAVPWHNHLLLGLHFSLSLSTYIYCFMDCLPRTIITLGTAHNARLPPRLKCLQLRFC